MAESQAAATAEAHTAALAASEKRYTDLEAQICLMLSQHEAQYTTAHQKLAGLEAVSCRVVRNSGPFSVFKLPVFSSDFTVLHPQPPY